MVVEWKHTLIITSAEPMVVKCHGKDPHVVETQIITHGETK